MSQYFTPESTGLSLDQILGSTNGITFAGAFFGCLAASLLSDRMGRVRAIQIICCICIVGAVLQAASVHIAMLFIGRFIGGLGSGMINSTVPLYQSEVAPARARGRMVGVHGFLLVTGYAMAAWSGCGCYFEPNQQIQWRLLFALQVVTPATLLAASLMLPESPRWLIAQAKSTMAREILSKLHSSPDGNDILARREFFEIEQQIELDKTKPATLRAMVMTPSYRWRLLTGILLQ
jgi:MFS family permease